MPVRVVWARFQTLRMQRAVESLDTARAIGLALGGDKPAIEQASDEAFPGG